MKHQKFFTKSLLEWNNNINIRQMPWKGEKDPYKIWISEIILQQTRVQQGTDYYSRFIKKFPDVRSLAVASENDVYKLWEGLGYYSRCKNLIVSAKYIHEHLSDQFPSKYDEILLLKGIGNYTASAIASFAFDLPYAVLDGNVYRVLSRFFGINIPINSTEGKRFYQNLSQNLIDKKNPAAYNQGIMDFGAIVCKPASPLCSECPLKKKCIAFLQNNVTELPVKNAANKQKKRFFNYLVIEYNQKFYLNKRTAKDIWQNLYEFILIETKNLLKDNALMQNESFKTLFNENIIVIQSMSEILTQKLTHQIISAKFIHIKIRKPLNEKSYFTAGKNDFKTLPFPKLITSYLAQKNVPLD